MVSTKLSVMCSFVLDLLLDCSDGLSLRVNGRDVDFTTVFGVNTRASTLSLSGWLHAAGGFREATWTTGASESGGSLEDSLFAWRLACFRWAWCRSHLSLSHFCLDGGFCFLVGLGWWIAAICPGWPSCVELPLVVFCCHWKWTATPFSSCVIVYLQAIYIVRSIVRLVQVHTQPLGMVTFQKKLASFCTEVKIHINPESTRIFLLSQKVCKPWIYLHQLSGREFTFLSWPSSTSAKWVPPTQENRMLDIEV